MARQNLSVDTAAVNPQTTASRGASHWRSSNVVLQVVVGVLVVVGGVGITASAPFFPKETTSGIKIGATAIGNVLTLVGTVLLSWVIARAVSAREAQREYEDDMDRVSQALGQIYGQLNNAVESAVAGSFATSETPFALIEQTSGTVRALVTQIQSEIGREFESEPIVTTKKALDELTSILYSGDAVDRIKAGELVNEARVALAQVQRTVTLPVNVPEEVKCPSCGAGNTVLLGASAGSTRVGTCPSCGSRFNVHRRGDGSLYVRLRPDGVHGSVAASEPIVPRSTVTLECTCGEEIVASFREDGTGRKPIVCSHCARMHEVSIPDGAVLSTTQFEIVDGEVIGFTKSGQPVTRCPVCRAPLRCAMRDRSRKLFFAYCLSDERLMRISEGTVDAAREDTPS